MNDTLTHMTLLCKYYTYINYKCVEQASQVFQGSDHEITLP